MPLSLRALIDACADEKLALSDIEKGGELTLAAKCFARLVRRNARLIELFLPESLLTKYLCNIHIALAGYIFRRHLNTVSSCRS
jgi:hypothetical protein